MKTGIAVSLSAVALLAGIAVALSEPVGAASAARARLDAAQHVPDEVLVKFRPDIAAGNRLAAVAARGHSLLADLGKPRWVRVGIGAGQTVERALAAYREDPGVEYAQPNFFYRTAAAPNDTQYGQLWAFQDMNMEKAWDRITDCGGVVVAVVDSGVNYNQEDLAANMWNGGTAHPNHGVDFVDGDNDPMDLHGHGTHVAGIIGAVGNNARGTTGVCWSASVMAVRVVDATGIGTTANILQGVNFAVANRAKVINMSLGGGAFDQAFSDAVTSAQSADVVVVVAAGNEAANNDGGTTPTYPCNFPHPNIVCVAALDQGDLLATFSNYGTTSVDVVAPGTDILSTWAGTAGVVTDNLTSGWTTSTTTAGGWAFGTLSLDGVPTAFLLDPAAYPSAQYNNATDDRVRKSFNLAGIDAARLELAAAINVVNGDHFRVGYAVAGGDPFAGGTVADDVTGISTYPNLIPGEWDISDCIGANCSVGFQLQSDPLQTDRGVAITMFGIRTLTLDATSYAVSSGTSMATPEVAGLAALLRAYNPRYSYTEVVNAILQGGRPVAALDGKTATGKAIDAVSSLAYINPPTGLAAAVQ